MRTLFELQNVLAQLGFAQMRRFLAESEFLHAFHLATSVVEFFHMTHHNHWRFVLLKRVIHTLQKGEIVAIVGVGKPHIAPPSSGKTRIARRRKPSVHLMRYNANARVGGGELLRDGQAAVGRAIVHDDGFPIGEQLVLQIAQGGGKVGLGAIRGQNNRKERGSRGLGWDVCGAHRARSFCSACTATGSIGVDDSIAASMRSGSIRGIDAHGAITPPRGGRTVRFALAVMSFSHMPSAPHEL